MALDDRIEVMVGIIFTKAGRIERAAHRLMLWFWARSEGGVFGWIGDRFDDWQCWLAHRRGGRFVRRRADDANRTA